MVNAFIRDLLVELLKVYKNGKPIQTLKWGW